MQRIVRVAWLLFVVEGRREKNGRESCTATYLLSMHISRYVWVDTTPSSC